MEVKTKHLTIGSPQPSKTEGLRLYSFEYCPYAQRVRLVLQAKGLKYEAVNINLKNKPEWYPSVHPEQKVPVLDTGNEIITESLDIANYLEEKYPSPALYPAEPAAVNRDKQLIEKLNEVTKIFGKCMINPKEKSAEEWMKDFLAAMEPFENELRSRGTKFFAGDKPGMVDYMLWPWGERAKCLGMLIGQKLPLGDEDIPTLMEWQKNMREDPAVKAVYNGPEKCYKAIQLKYTEENPDFDSI